MSTNKKSNVPNNKEKSDIEFFLRFDRYVRGLFSGKPVSLKDYKDGTTR
jgi:hypothetical protein